MAWLFYALYGATLCVISCIVTTWWGTGASGSGVAEIIGYVNGVNYPDCIGVKTVITKMFGVVLAVAGGLTVGKEGPLAHIGGNLGAMTAYLPGLAFMRNDWRKREYVAAGASAGVSIAFGAPIGGALFLYELSRGNPFWTFPLLWKVFLTCATAVFTLGVADALLHGKPIDWSESALKFGAAPSDLKTPTILLPGAIVLGIVSGLLGPFFININTRVNGLRAKLYPSKWQKPLDCFIFAFLTASCFYWVPNNFATCIPRPDHLDEKLDTVFDRMEDMTTSRAWCSSKDEYNPLATIFWKTEGGVIKQFLGTPMACTPEQMMLFTGVWYFWTITTYGVNVPSGLFLPGMIIGCGLGDLYIHFLLHLQKQGNINIGVEHTEQFRSTYIVLAMGAMLAGYTRMTYSIIVIVMETSQSINIFLPTAIAVGIANFTGDLFTRGLYDRAVRAKQMPILTDQVALSCRYVRAEQMMSTNILTLNVVDSVENIYAALKSSHHGFPVLNSKQRVVGLIPKNYLWILIFNKAFYDKKMPANPNRI